MRHNVKLFIILFAILVPQSTFSQNTNANLQQVKNLIKVFPGNVGVCMISDAADTICINENQRFPLLSVMKLHQALAISHFCNQSKISFAKHVRVKSKDLMKNTWSPMRERNPLGGKYTVAELIKFSLEESDNNACNILSDKVLGMDATNKLIHDIGFADCQILSDERSMMKDVNVCYDNWSTPLETVRLLEWLYERRDTHKLIWSSMSECKTGGNRISRYLNNVSIVHKTGTGPVLPNGKILAVNDIAFILFPDNRHYSLAIFITDSDCDVSECEQLIAEISRLCFNLYCRNKMQSLQILE